MGGHSGHTAVATLGPWGHRPTQPLNELSAGCLALAVSQRHHDHACVPCGDRELAVKQPGSSGGINDAISETRGPFGARAPYSETVCTIYRLLGSGQGATGSGRLGVNGTGLGTFRPVAARGTQTYNACRARYELPAVCFPTDAAQREATHGMLTQQYV